MTTSEFEAQVYRVMKVVLAIPDADHKIVAEKCRIDIPELNKTLAFIKQQNLLDNLDIATGGSGRNSKIVFYDTAQPTMAGLDFMKRFEKEGTPHLTEEEKPSVFVSYNQKSGSAFVDFLEEELSICAKVIRDKSSLDPWESFSEFMKSIRKQDFAVLVITKEYLQSTACMFEVSELMKDDDWKNKVMFAVLDDSIFSASSADFIQYWQKAEENKKTEANGIEPKNMGSITDELRKIDAIQYCLGEFLSVVKDSNNPRTWAIKDAIINRIKKENNIDFTSDLDNTPYAEKRQHEIDKALGRL